MSILDLLKFPLDIRFCSEPVDLSVYPPVGPIEPLPAGLMVPPLAGPIEPLVDVRMQLQSKLEHPKYTASTYNFTRCRTGLGRLP